MVVYSVPFSTTTFGTPVRSANLSLLASGFSGTGFGVAAATVIDLTRTLYATQFLATNFGAPSSASPFYGSVSSVATTTFGSATGRYRLAAEGFTSTQLGSATERSKQLASSWVASSFGDPALSGIFAANSIEPTSGLGTPRSREYMVSYATGFATTVLGSPAQGASRYRAIPLKAQITFGEPVMTVTTC